MPAVLPDIVEEHLDELDFLWELREASVFSPDWTLVDLGWTEERAEAHLDALRLAGEAAVELARERLSGDEPSAACAAARLLVEGTDDRRRAVIEALHGGRPELALVLRLALRHARIELVEPALRELSRSAAPAAALAALDVLAFHRRPLELPSGLRRPEDPRLASIALGVLGRSRALTSEDLEAAQASPDESLRRCAWHEAARSGLAGVRERCRAAAGRNDTVALAFLGVLGEADDVAVLRAAVANPELAPAALQGLGALGRIESVPWILQALAQEPLRALAAQAYRRITGAVFAGEGIDRFQADWSSRSASLDPERAWQSGLALEPRELPQGFASLALDVRRDVFLRFRALGAAPDLELEALVTRQGS